MLQVPVDLQAFLNFSSFPPGYTGSSAPPLSGPISCFLSPTQDAPQPLFLCWLPVQDFDLLWANTPACSRSNCCGGSQRTLLPWLCQHILHKDLCIKRFVCNTVGLHVSSVPHTDSDFSSSHPAPRHNTDQYISGEILIPSFNFYISK